MAPTSRTPTSAKPIAPASRLARFSLVVVVVTFLGNPSCLITSTAAYQEPVASPPFVDANTALATPRGGVAVPVTRWIQISQDTREVTLEVDVRSDDAGRLLRSRVLINYNNRNHPKPVGAEGGDSPYDYMFGGAVIPASTFDEVRPFKTTFDPDKLPDNGCYQVSLVIAHQFDDYLHIPMDQDDAAILVWWMVKGDPSAMRLDRCPGLTPTSSENPGSDGGF